MTKRLVALLATASAVGLCTVSQNLFAQEKEATAEPGKPVWNDVTTGFALAKKLNKPIITDFYTDWCGWCKVMDRKTYDNPDVIKVMSQNFVLVKANAEDHGAGERLARQNLISGYPTAILFDSSGKAKATIVGYKEAKPFTKILNAFLDGKAVPN